MQGTRFFRSARRCFSFCAVWGAALISLFTPALAHAAQAACSMKITSVYTCDSNGNPVTPRVGDTYWIRANWDVTGTPKSAYSVTFAEAFESYTVTGMPAEAGDGWWIYVGWPLPLDSKIPCTVTLDPDNVTGAPTAGRKATFSFTPKAPSSSIQYFNTATFTGGETATVDWVDDSGEVTSGFTWLGAPTTDTFEKVLSAEPPAGGEEVTTDPSGDPVFETDFQNYSPVAGNDTWVCTDNFKLALSGVRVNPSLLRKATWADLQSVSSSMQAWLQPDSMVQSNDPVIASFVGAVLPSGYQTTMTPYDAARALFLAVVQRTTYNIATAPPQDAVYVYNNQVGNCLGFSTLLNACLRYIGIPSRCICGFWQGDSQWHCLLEFYLPGSGWVPADASEDKINWDPSGTYSCLFGSDPFLNTYCAVTRGTAHDTSYMIATEMQVALYYYYGDAISDGINTNSALTETGAPPAPQSLNAFGSGNEVALAWTPSIDTTSYDVYRATAPGEEKLYVSDVTGNTYFDEGVALGTTYYYKVAAVNGHVASGRSNEASSLPLAPIGLKATAGTGQVSLKWMASPGAVTYSLYRGTASNSESATPIKTGLSGTAYTDSGLISGQTYYYKVKAVGDYGISAYSNQSSAIAH